MKKYMILCAGMFVLACASPHKKADLSTVNEAIAPPEVTTATDTICGMPVDLPAADTVHFNGKVYSFCGASCKAAFLTTIAKRK